MINQTVKKRCQWAKDEPNITYHDDEWGIPVRDDQKLFENLTLESAQAGLSWYTILKRREAYRKAFSYFDINKVATYTDHNVETLLNFLAKYPSIKSLKLARTNTARARVKY